MTAVRALASPAPPSQPRPGQDTGVAAQTACRADPVDTLEDRLNLSALFDVVKSVHPAAGLDALAWELGRRVGAEEVSLLVVDIEGQALVRLAGKAERDLDVDEAPVAQRVALRASAAGTAIREQRLQVVPDGPGVRVYAPVSERGETVGVLELRLPTPLSAQVATYLAAAAHALAYVVIADRRHTDVYEVSQRSTTLSLEAEIQRRLLPPSYSCEGPQFALAGWQVPASSAGGDTFDYVVGERTLSLSVTDAMGHGVAAAQLATLAVGSLRNSRRAGLGLAEQAERASDALAEHAGADQFVTALLVEVDLDTGAADVVNAGHVRPLLVRDGRVAEVDLESDLVLGVLPGLPYRRQQLLLEPGDRLVLMTDGMFERQAADAEVATLLGGLSPMHPREAAQVLTRAVLDVSAGAVRDDATVMVLDWYGPGSPRSSAGRTEIRSRSSLTGRVEVPTDDAVVTLVGPVPTSALPLLTSMLATAATLRGAVTVDVSGVRDLDRTGIVALEQAAARLRAEGRQLTVRGAGPPLSDVLQAAARFDAPAPARPATLSPALRHELVARAGAGSTREVLDAALKLVVTMAQAVIGNADGVSITLPRDGRYGTVAASNDVVLAMDHDQYDTGQGPCLDAARHGEPFHIDSLALEQRWSQFVPRARARGIESILSSPLRDAGAAHGALNIYARRTGAFAGHEKQWADEFAAQASTVLTLAHDALPPGLDGQLEQALASRAAIARAQGWVMQRDQVDADTAWSALTETSRRTSRPLRDVCEELLRPVDGAAGGHGHRRA